jgi:hypothetical protein
MTVRVPVYVAPGEIHWRNVTLGLSRETGDAFVGRSDKKGNKRDRARRDRAIRDG